MVLNDVETQMAHELFTLIDKDGDGGLQLDELFSLNVEESAALMACDFDDDNQISREEWFAFMTIKKAECSEEGAFEKYIKDVKQGMRQCMQVRKLARELDEVVQPLRDSLGVPLPPIAIPREEFVFSFEVHHAATYLFGSDSTTLSLVLADFCLKAAEVVAGELINEGLAQELDNLINDHFKPACHAALITKGLPAANESEARFTGCLPHKPRRGVVPTAMARRKPAVPDKGIIAALHQEITRQEIEMKPQKMEEPQKMEVLKVAMIKQSVCRMLGEVNGRGDFNAMACFAWNLDGSLMLNNV